MRWFKMHCEARTDAKLQILTDKQFRYWFNLLCYAAERQTRGVISDYDIPLLAIEVAGGDEEGLKETLSILEKLKIISIKENEITFINFNKRQYEKPSDQPNAVKERVRKHRAKKDSTNFDDVTPCNAKNRSDQNRSDQNQNRTEQSGTEEKEIPIYVEFVNWFNFVFGKNHKPSAYREKILARLKTYTVEQLKQACLNMKKDPFMMGSNDRNKVYATLEYITRNDKNVDKWLNQVPVNRREVIR